MHVYMYIICMSACIYTYMHLQIKSFLSIYIYTYTWLPLHVHICTCKYTYIKKKIYTYIYICMWSKCNFLRIYNWQVVDPTSQNNLSLKTGRCCSTSLWGLAWRPHPCPIPAFLPLVSFKLSSLQSVLNVVIKSVRIAHKVDICIQYTLYTCELNAHHDMSWHFLRRSDST